jgi:3-oxoadipate enol-lactonase
MLERCPVAGYAGTCAALRDADLRAQVGQIGLQTLAVVGEEDGSTPPELVRETVGMLPDARLEIIEGGAPAHDRTTGAARRADDGLFH